MNNCKYDILLKSTDKCEYVSNCEYDYFYFNILKTHYCQFNSSLYISVPLFILIILICFFLLSDTAHKYFSSTLTIISEKLKLSQNIAAMTLLALGNGSPDIISSIVASLSSDNNDGDSLGMSIGGLLGSGIVLTTLVFALVILFSENGIEVIPKMFVREGLFYIFSLFLLLIFSIDGKIVLWEAVSFIFIYFINLMTAIYIESNSRTIKKNKSTDQIIIVEGYKNIINTNSQYKEDDNVRLVNATNSNRKDSDRDSIQSIEVFVENVVQIAKKKKNEDIDSCIVKEQLHDKSIKLLNQKEGVFFRIKRHYFDNIDDFSSMNTIQKIIYIIIQFPFNILRDISIPAVDNKRYEKRIFSLFPIISLLASITLLNKWKLVIDYWIFFTIIGCCCIIISILFFFYLNETIPKIILPICIINFLMSIIWIYSITNIIVDTIKFFGFIFHIPSSYLGLTILALGNSAPDTGLNCSLSKSGFGEMAIAGTMAGPFFNLIIGLGLTLLIKVYKNPIKFEVFGNEDKPNLITFISLIVNLVITLVLAKIYNYHLNKINAYISLSIFVSYIFLISFFTFF